MLSLAIGREGQNARLAARLTGWRIDIRSDVSAAEARPRPPPRRPPAPATRRPTTARRARAAAETAAPRPRPRAEATRSRPRRPRRPAAEGTEPRPSRPPRRPGQAEPQGRRGRRRRDRRRRGRRTATNRPRRPRRTAKPKPPRRPAAPDAAAPAKRPTTESPREAAAATAEEATVVSPTAAVRAGRAGSAPGGSRHAPASLPDRRRSATSSGSSGRRTAGSSSTRPAAPPAGAPTSAPTAACWRPALERGTLDRALASRCRRTSGRRSAGGTTTHDHVPRRRSTRQRHRRRRGDGRGIKEEHPWPEVGAAPAAGADRASHSGATAAFATTAVQVADPRERGAIELPSTITVKELADLLDVNPADVIRELIKSGIFASINQLIDRDTASLVAGELGYEVAEPTPPARRTAPTANRGQARRPSGEGSPVRGRRSGRPAAARADRDRHGPRRPRQDEPARRDPDDRGRGRRAGRHHPAHRRERGHQGRQARRLPRHPGPRGVHRDARPRRARSPTSRWSSWRPTTASCPRRSRRSTTRKAAKVPIIIALNKIDKADANPDRVKTELSEAGIIVEEYGGDTPLVPVSARTRAGHRRAARDGPARRRPPGAEGEPEAGRGGHDRRGAARQGPRPRRDRPRPDRHAAGRRHDRRRRHVRQGPRARERQGQARPEGRPVDAPSCSSASPRSRRPATSCASSPTRSRLARWSSSARPQRPPAAATAGPRHARGPLPADPGRPDQGAADRPQGRRLGLARARSTHALQQLSTGRGADQHPPRGRRRHHRQRHPAGVRVERDRRRVQHESPTPRVARPRPRASTSGLYDIIYKLTDDIQAALAGPARAGAGRGHRRPRRDPPDLPGRQEHGHRGLVTSPTAGSSVAARPVYRSGKVVATDRIDSLRRFRDDVREVAHELRVRHRPGELSTTWRKATSSSASRRRR